MPKPRSPEFKVAPKVRASHHQGGESAGPAAGDRRSLASRRPIEKNQKPKIYKEIQKESKKTTDEWTPSDEELDPSGAPCPRSGPAGGIDARSSHFIARVQKLRSPATAPEGRGSQGPTRQSDRGQHPPQRHPTRLRAGAVSPCASGAAAPRSGRVGATEQNWTSQESQALRPREVQSDFDYDDESAPGRAETSHPTAQRAQLNALDSSGPRKYPEAIENLIELSLMEADQVREAFKGRRQNYVRIFQAYKDKLADRDYSIIRGATGYLYENSRIKSINEDTALWMLGIYEIPASQIQSYTSKAILEKIAKNCGLSISGKKAEVLIKNIRSVIDSSK